jgi:hypothetical protein
MTKSNGSESGVSVCYDGNYRAITGVINTFELAGDNVRAQLLEKIREAVLEAKALRENAKRLFIEHYHQQG